ncbi:MAG: rRNA adenine dimethyltransferase family protein, partial [Pigmentiphaga sp.]
MNQHQARKRFGQHFLVDDAMIESIVRAIAPARDDNLVEIGPGLSALTRPLLQRLDRLRVIELDRDLAARLRREWPEERLAITEADALTVDFSGFGPGLRVVGNLPYNISTPILFHLMNFADQIRDQHFMLQREVVERMVARPGG